MTHVDCSLFILGALLGLIFLALIVWDYQRAQRKRRRCNARAWPNCPFCPPVQLFNNYRRLYPKPASIARRTDDGRAYEWAWCRCCGASMHGDEWHAPEPDSPSYRGDVAAAVCRGDFDASGESSPASIGEKLRRAGL